MLIRKRTLHLRFAWSVLFALIQATSMPAGAQGNPTPPSPAPSAGYSGMYSFLREGEFVQLTVEDGGHIIGFISRYADPEGEGGFLDHFFKSAALEGNHLAFVTKTVHGVSFEFRGVIERGEGKARGDEAFYVLKGTLVENSTDATNKTTSRSSDVSLKSFPQDLAPPQSEKK